MRFARSKYRNNKTVVFGISFDSKHEAQTYMVLKGDKKVADIRLQVPFELVPAYTDASGKKVKAMNYIADFVCIDTKTGKTRVIDAKGFRTQYYLLKKKLFNYRYFDQGLYLEEV